MTGVVRFKLPSTLSFAKPNDHLTGLFYDTTPPVGGFTRTPRGDWPQYVARTWDDGGATHHNIGSLDFVERDGQAKLNCAGTLM